MQRAIVEAMNVVISIHQCIMVQKKYKSIAMYQNMN